MFTFGELGYLKPVVLFNNGKTHCIFNKEYQCTIYEERPSICQVYPLSANLDNVIYYDSNCPALQDFGQPLITDNQISTSFYNEILDDYQTKYIFTHRELEPFNNKNDFELVTTIHQEKFYKYVGHNTNSYIQMHFQSLINLKKYNLC